MKIGYQGIEGSNSEAVAKQYIQEENIKNAELVPLVNSKNVVNALLNEDIDIGVMATYNLKAGIVTETEEALKNIELKQIKEIRMPIHHCVFKKKNVDIKDIEIVSSHIQAIGQTKGNLSRLLPNCKTQEVEDTALAAKDLAQGNLADNVAIICRKNAGEMYDLDLVFENIEDDSNNITLFGIYTK